MTGFTGWLRPALAGLTTRGRAFLASGAAAAVCAVLLGQRDLLRVAVLLIVLPLAFAVALGRTHHRLGLSRTITPQRVVAGSTARVRLELENLTRVSTRVLLAEDEVPHALGARPRFVVARLAGRRRAAVTYALRSHTRGRYAVGPLTLLIADPFGMCEVTRSFSTTDPLVVVPRTWPLAPVRAGGRWSGSGESQARAAATGEDDITVREYRHGDDLRRVHWRSTARRGELMVRRDERPRQLWATVLLDGRREGHRGEGPSSSFEWAVSAAASAALALAGERYGVRLLLDGHAAGRTDPSSPDGADALLDGLATVTRTGPDSLGASIGTLSRVGGDGLVVAVLGEITEDEATALAVSERRGARAMAILLRTTQWVLMPPKRAAELDAARARAATVLRSGGWAVTEAGPEETVAQVWDRLIGRAAGVGPANGTAPRGLPVDGVPVRGTPANGAVTVPGAALATGPPPGAPTGNGLSPGAPGNGLSPPVSRPPGAVS